MLALRRLTEAQLRAKLEARGYDDEAIGEAVASCYRSGFLDDKLFAALYVEGKRKSVGDARLTMELVRKGIDRDAAARAVQEAPLDERERIADAYEKLLRTRPSLSYPSAARALERLGFPTPLIYRALREHAAEHGPFADLAFEES
jgi:SOS response regulatory protein OraA/RecX